MPVSFDFESPASSALEAAQPGFPTFYMAAILNAFGRISESIIGRPSTLLIADAGPEDDVLFVETTLGFSDVGELWMGPYRVAYTGKTAGSFTGCSGRYRDRIFGASTVVTLHIPSVAAD